MSQWVDWWVGGWVGELSDVFYLTTWQACRREYKIRMACMASVQRLPFLYKVPTRGTCVTRNAGQMPSSRAADRQSKQARSTDRASNQLRWYTKKRRLSGELV